MNIAATRVLIAGLGWLAGCAASTAYRADYVTDEPVAESDRVQGQVLIYTTRDDDDRLITAGTASCTESGAKLTTPIGIM
jgi:hypothetical protein